MNYRVSTDSSLDQSTITDTAWYTIVGLGDNPELADDFSLDGGGPGYAAPGWVPGEDISTDVDDNAIGDVFTNYVWRVTVIPEPTSMLVAGLGTLGLLIR